ncbi:plant intracellular Ras-group-related LRR protein 6-like, partial [Morus notabilis]|uniref:plant intracellular Ras-group-related LRR protein 6-like n=1 Tax=Morus notabilis TaxID=981085 RepID=UPI000CED5365
MMFEKQQMKMDHNNLRRSVTFSTSRGHNNNINSDNNSNNFHHQKRKSKDDNQDHERLEIVDLSGMSLESLPNTPLNLGIICKLDLSNNNLQIIPESLIARLLNVVVLDVHSNQLRSLPNSIGCLSKLKVLNVSGNLLESLPKTIENCRSLEELNANFNKLTKLPDTIGFELNNLRKLSVNSNKLVFLPHSLTHLTSLRALDARLNCLRSLPDDLENLINLEVLNVSQNFQYLETLPYSIGLLLSLVELDVSYNKIGVVGWACGFYGFMNSPTVEVCLHFLLEVATLADAVALALATSPHQPPLRPRPPVRPAGLGLADSY